MASLQRLKVKGYTYFRIVESRRVNGKPRVRVLAHLGNADALLKRLQGADQIKTRSRSHGAVASLHALAEELQVAATIDRHLSASGRRDRRNRGSHKKDPTRRPRRHDGLTVGQTLTLAAIGRACHATSKAAFAEWANETTLGDLFNVRIDGLSSQHFWDQMDQLPIEVIPAIEKEVIQRAIDGCELTLDLLLFDATNFFTFISSTNRRPKLPARGKQKQKRTDLRQVGVALLCSRDEGIPLWHCTYGGAVADATCFAEVLPRIQERMIELGRNCDDLTIVYDKGNVSKANQKLVDDSEFHYVTAMPTTNQRKLVAKANTLLAPVDLGHESIMAHRTRATIWGAERTVVLLVSERLRQGQMRGVMQHVESALRWLEDLAATLRRGKQRRDRPRIERDIEHRLKGRQHLRTVLQFDLAGQDPNLNLTYTFDKDAFNKLADESFGRVLLLTDRHDWSAAQIIRAYRDQADIEAVFAHLKDPIHVALRPQHHWTDQKLHVHVLTCILGYLLARLLHLRARRLGAPYKSPEHLLDSLARVRQATIARSITGKGPLRLATQLEETDPELLALFQKLTSKAS